MYVSAKIQYATAIMRAVASSDEPLTLEVISDRHNLSPEFMYQIARTLREAKWLHSKRGPGGGYSAIKKTGTMLEISELMAGKTRKTEDFNGLNENVAIALGSIKVF